MANKNPVDCANDLPLYIYQKTPGNFHNHCRFIPTCSNYAKEAIENYGAFRGSILAIKRVLRCHPLGSSGYDPVPKRRRKE